jgi:DNA-directed RNA polymerase specialized sigma24 family protein
MLWRYRRMLRREDLEDCLSQAVFELLARGCRGRRFASREHVANTLEQRFLSRVHDRRRALSGRSPMQAALESALPLGGAGERGVELADPRADVHPLAAHREQLRLVAGLAPLLSSDQRLVLACQVTLGMGRAEFCRRFGWSHEKYRKVAQRARARLRGLVDADPRVGANPHRPIDSDPRGGVNPHRPIDSDHRGGVNPNPRTHVPPARGSRTREVRTHL